MKKKRRMIDRLIFLNKVTGYSLSADEMQMCEDGQQEPGILSVTEVDGATYSHYHSLSERADNGDKWSNDEFDNQ